MRALRGGDASFVLCVPLCAFVSFVVDELAFGPEKEWVWNHE
jgi:hypothetical protein